MKCDELAIERLDNAQNRFWSEHSLGGTTCTIDEYLADEMAANEFFGRGPIMLIPDVTDAFGKRIGGKQ